MADIKTRKRLIVACDGTWVNSDNGLVYATGKLATPSNVTRICRAMLPRSSDGIPQIVYYQGGLGSQNNMYSWFFGGYLGDGISDNIREAYAFLCNNYEPGDEIIFIGFSRGAFVARSVSGLIASIGLLNKTGLSVFYPIFKDWENQLKKDYKPMYGAPVWPLENRPVFEAHSTAYVDKLVADKLTRYPIPVKAIGVWDTVGSLGVPSFKSPWLGFPLHTQTTKEYSFINTEVAPNVSYAYQALALDEKRTPFLPTIWESPKPGSNVSLQELKQTWFPGVHTTVGGGYADSSISDVTLAWMMRHLAPHVAFEPGYLELRRKANVQFYEDQRVEVKEWALGLIKRSDTGLLNTMMGRTVRTPGVYNRLDAKTEEEMNTGLFKTCEFIHPCVRWRWKLNNVAGTGIAENDNDANPKTVYAPAALKDWEYIPPGKLDEAKYGKRPEMAKWEENAKWAFMDEKKGEFTFIVEERIVSGSLEDELLSGWPNVKEELRKNDAL